MVRGPLGGHNVLVQSPQTRGNPHNGRAFLKGGLGCLVAFVVLGGACVAIGGSMYIDFGGAVILFLLGGIGGLIVNAVYHRGRRDASAAGPPEPPEPPEHPFRR